jgi:hypothetical protein
VKHVRARRVAITLLLGLTTLLWNGCAATYDGYGYDAGPGIGRNYYDPMYGGYGVWGPGYRVAPFGYGGYGFGRPGYGPGRPPPRAYMPAPGVRPIPSIPSRPHGRGSRPRR